MEEREIQKQLEPKMSYSQKEKTVPAVKTITEQDNAGGNGKKEKVEFSLEEKIKLREKFSSVRSGKLSGLDHHLVAYNDSNSPIADQYRIIRTNLKTHLKKKNGSARISLSKSSKAGALFAVTSSQHNEGKTLTAANLAISCAQDLESKVLLIDCDLRNGSVHELFNVGAKPGLSEILSSDLDYSVGLTPTLISNLFVLPRGRISLNASELMESRKMRFILEQLRDEPFTYIILDTPPLTPFTDAATLGAHTDGAVLVVESGRTQKDMAVRSKEFLQGSHCNILGCILNKVDSYAPDMYGYYNYYYKHAGRKN